MKIYAVIYNYRSLCSTVYIIDDINNSLIHATIREYVLKLRVEPYQVKHSAAMSKFTIVDNKLIPSTAITELSQYTAPMKILFQTNNREEIYNYCKEIYMIEVI